MWPAIMLMDRAPGLFFEQAIWFERKADAYGLKNYTRDLAERRDPGVPSRLRAGKFGMSHCEAVFAGPAYPAGKVPVAPCSGCAIDFFKEDLKVCGSCKGQQEAPFYCSPECQKKDWRRHKSQCKSRVNTSLRAAAAELL